MGFGMVLGHLSSASQDDLFVTESQELYSRPTLDTPHFPKASWYVSSLYHIISHCTCSNRLESPSRVDASSSPATCWSGLKLKAPNGRHLSLKSCFREDQMDQRNRTIFSSLSSNTFRTAVWHVAWYWVCWRMALEFHVVKNSSPWVLASGVGTWSGRARVNELVQIIGSNFLNLPSRDSWKHFDNIYIWIYIYIYMIYIMNIPIYL